jgi:DNA gyrase subunit A
MIINKSGITIRLAVSEVRFAGRATQGVKLINLRNGDTIAAVTKVDAADEVIDVNQSPVPNETSDNDS